MRPLILAATLVAFALPAQADDVLSLAGFEQTCLSDHLSDCRVSGAGIFTAEAGPLRFAWQTQTGFTPEDGVLGGIVLLQPVAGGWAIIDADYTAYRYQAPLFIDDSLIHVPGRTGGSGGYNADLLLQHDDAGWRRIDTTAWLDGIGALLPAGHEIWQGVSYDFAAMTASTPLWRPDDANGAPTGGFAVIDLDIDGDTLVATAVRAWH